MRKRNSVRLLAAAVTVAVVAATAGFTLTAQRLLPTSGLRASCWNGPSADGAPAFTAEYDRVTTRSVRARFARLGGGAFTCEWRGYLIVPATAAYRFGVIPEYSVEIEIDKQRMAARHLPAALGSMTLTRGLHPITIRYVALGPRQALDFMWASGAGTPSQLPAVLLVPGLVPSNEVRVRRAVAWLSPVVPAAGSALLLAAAAWAFVYGLRRTQIEPTPPARLSEIAVVGLAVIAFGTAMWWGLPDSEGWAPDEIVPTAVRVMVDERFMGTASQWYPPFHSAVLALFTSPFHALAALGVIDLDALRVDSAAFVMQRAVTVVMSLGIVWLILRIGRSLGGRMTGVLGALTLIGTLPMAYYAKTANLDVPYAFWFTLSMWYYLQAFQGGATRDFLLFAGFGALAIATKDQAYGLFVLPALVIMFRAPIRVTLLMGAVAIAALAVGNNAILNPAGFREHVRLITGPSTAIYRMYPPTVAGQLSLFVDSLRQLGGSMSWPLFVAAVAGVLMAWRARVTPILLLLVAVASYHATFIAVVAYQYDRFFLSPIVVLCVAAGWGLNQWLGPGVRWRGLRVAAVTVAFAYALARVAALDTLMTLDSRLAAEAWLLPHADAGARIVAAGHYLPRRGTLFWLPIELDLEKLAAANPDLIVVNAAYATRQVPGSGRGEFYTALAAGRTPYHRVFSTRTYLWWSPLNLESRFTAAREDPSTNLSKLNPLIEVYAK